MFVILYIDSHFFSWYLLQHYQWWLTLTCVACLTIKFNMFMLLTVEFATIIFFFRVILLSLSDLISTVLVIDVKKRALKIMYNQCCLSVLAFMRKSLRTLRCSLLTQIIYAQTN